MSVERPEPHPASSTVATLRCQWCSVPLFPGSTRCPTCGSPGVPDPVFDKPEPVADPVARLLAGDVLDDDTTPQTLPWQDDHLTAEAAVTATSRRRKPTPQEAAERQAQTLKFGLIAVVACVFLGWLAGPLLAGSFESFTGAPVQDSGDLRPLGGFLGLLTGLIVGGAGGVIIWSSR